MVPVVLCVLANSRTGLFSQAIHLEPAALAALILAALAPLLGLIVLWSRMPFRVPPVTQWSYWFYPGHLAALLGIRSLM
ncbi:hypothetical protein L1F19_26470 [Pseudomonas juntendi]|nr:hypothetical protein [Pseudomonas juntendi]